jgi:hypothetical protein
METKSKFLLNSSTAQHFRLYRYRVASTFPIPEICLNNLSGTEERCFYGGNKFKIYPKFQHRIKLSDQNSLPLFLPTFPIIRKGAFLNRDIEAPRLRSLHPTSFFDGGMHWTDLPRSKCCDAIRSG